MAFSPHLSPWFKIQSSLLALKILNSKIGFFATTSVLAGTALRKLRGEPWKGLPEPLDLKEKLSREQCQDAVVLYRALCGKFEKGKAQSIISGIILKASILFLSEQVPTISSSDMKKMGPDERKDFVLGLAEKFFNADMGAVRINENSFQYEIVRCRFVELTAQAGHPELAEMFCEGDGIFFDEHQPEVVLERTTTLAKSGAPCDFHFKIKSER